MRHLRRRRPITNPLIRRNRNPLHHLPDITFIPFSRSLGNSGPPLVQRDGLEGRRDPGLVGEDAWEFGEGEFGGNHGVGFGGGLAGAFPYYRFALLVYPFLFFSFLFSGFG